MNREDIIKELEKRGIADKVKVIFKKQSPYMKSRYKKEYIESEAWIYPKAYKSFGYLITESDWNEPKDLHAWGIMETLEGELKAKESEEK